MNVSSQVDLFAQHARVQEHALLVVHVIEQALHERRDLLGKLLDGMCLRGLACSCLSTAEDSACSSS
jgi:hypothetical protein